MLANDERGQLLNTRYARQPLRFKPFGTEGTTVIKKGWAETLTRDGYREHIKQATLIGAMTVALEDALLPGRERQCEMLKTRLNGLILGNEKLRLPDPVTFGRSMSASHSVGHAVVMSPRASEGEVHYSSQRTEGDPTEKDLLIKYGARLHRRAVRGFIIAKNSLIVYTSRAELAPMRHVYQLGAVEYYVEERSEDHQSPPFEDDYPYRIRIISKERLNGPMFLYSKDASQIKVWARAIRMAKLALDQMSSSCVIACLRRLAAGVRAKGWHELCRCYHAVKEIVQDCKMMTLRLERMQVHRGWSKLRLAYKQIKERERITALQQKWAREKAAQLLASGMKLQHRERPVLSADEVRERLVTHAQHIFRMFKNDCISRLGSVGTPAMQQVRRGLPTVVVFEALRCEDVLRLVLEPLGAQPSVYTAEATHPARATYSASVSSGLCESLAYVSECNAMLCFADRAPGGQVAELTDAPWQSFVHLGRISSAVLHSSPWQETPVALVARRAAAGSTAPPLATGGTWLTLHGPRVCWGRRATMGKEPGRATISGTTNGLAIPDAMTSGGRLPWVQCTVTIDSATIPIADTSVEATPLTYMRLSLFDRRVISEPQWGKNVNYSIDLQAGVPMPTDTKAYEVLDDSELCIDVVDAKIQEVAWYLRLPLWKLLSPGPGMPDSGMEKKSLSETLRTAKMQKVWSLALIQPGQADPIPGTGASVGVHITLEVQNPGMHGIGHDATTDCISPELIGCGSPCSLFSSHRGAWHNPVAEVFVSTPSNGKSAGALFDVLRAVDPEHSVAKSRVPGPERVPNFVEVNVGTLQLPPEPRSGLFGYHIEFRCRGVSVATDVVHRPRPAWKAVIPVSDDEVCFDGSKLVMALPPGFWAGGYLQPQVELVVFRRVQQDYPATSLQSFASTGEGPNVKQFPLEKLYHATLSLQGLELNQLTSVLHVPLQSFSPARDAAAAPTLQLSLALRDRDFVWTGGSDFGEDDSLCSLYVGDDCMLLLEESSTYPMERSDFRAQLWEGKWDVSKAGKPVAVPLRHPSLTHEYEDSGLGDLPDAQQFRPSLVLDHSRMVPYWFVLPASEIVFRKRKLPGVYWRVIDDLSSLGAASDSSTQVVVKRLTHLLQIVRCTVLAVYANRTCDLEVPQNFLRDWEREPNRTFLMPGILRKFGSDSNSRILLAGVPLSAVRAASTGGFNVYDCDFFSSQDAARSSVPQAAGGSVEDRKQIALRAGPVPVDASPAVCQYEWSVHIHAESDEVAHKFVRALRQCVRLDRFQKTNKLKQQLHHPVVQDLLPTPSPRSLAVPSPPNEPNVEGGQLEVVVVEARRLKPKRVQLGSNSLDALLAGASPAANVGSLLSDAEFNVFVAFRVLRDGAESDRQKFDVTPTIHSSDSPNWACLEELKRNGGWSFRTRRFDPSQTPDLIVELEVMHQGVTQESSLGVVRLPVGKGNYFTDQSTPFRNLWMPLTNVDSHGTRKLAACGALHVMTFWTPFESSGSSSKKARRSAQMYFKAETEHLAKSYAKSRDFVYKCSAMFGKFNPNCGVISRFREDKGDRAQHFAEAIGAQIAAQVDVAGYLQCCEQMQLQSWSQYSQALVKEGVGQFRLGELRLLWLERGEAARVSNLEMLIRGGVPQAWRAKVWPDMTLSSRVQEQQPEGEYRSRLASGSRLLPSSLPQLKEDVRETLAWDASDEAALHQRRVESAQNVCMAFFASAARTASGGPRGSRADGKSLGDGVYYSDDLFTLAYYLISADPNSPDQSLEERVFWLLYTLVRAESNGAYGDYHREPKRGDIEPRENVGSMSGAMEDVLLLECALVVHEADLWIHLNSVGFSLASIFYGAFTRLFARSLPVASLYQLWDILFTESTNPKAFPHARHGLVDFSFGVLRADRASLLKCDSASAITDQIERSLACLYDPHDVVGFADAAQALLWGGVKRNRILQLWRQSVDECKQRSSPQQMQQRLVLDELVEAIPLGVVTTGYDGGMRPGFTTKALAEAIIPAFRSASKADKGNSKGTVTTSAVPKRMLPQLQSADGGQTDVIPAYRFSNVFARSIQETCTAMTLAKAKKKTREVAPSGKCVVASRPDELDKAEFMSLIAREVPSWTALAQPLFDAFCSVHQDGVRSVVSLSDILVALIVRSQGTVAEKAAAIFDVFAQPTTWPSIGAGARLYHRGTPGWSTVQTHVAAVAPPASAGVANTRPSAVDVASARQTAQNVLGESFPNFSFRQLGQLADITYHRAGVVGGILSASLLRTDAARAAAQTVQRAAEEVDVRYHVLMELDRQASLRSASAPLTLSCRRGSFNLKSLGLADSLGRQKKSLWLRYVRAGDGERQGNVVVNFDETGEIEDPGRDVELDATSAMSQSEDVWLTKLCKEEFVACTLRSPLLSAALRRYPGVRGQQQQHSKSQDDHLTLDVSIVTTGSLTIGGSKPASARPPAREPVAPRDVLEYRVLLRLWAYNGGGGSSSSDAHFKEKWVPRVLIGEAWLPPLENLSHSHPEISLSLERSAEATEASKNPKAINRQVGTLFVTPLWTAFQPAQHGGVLCYRPSVLEKHFGDVLPLGDLSLTFRKADRLDLSHCKIGGWGHAYVEGHLMLAGGAAGPRWKSCAADLPIIRTSLVAIEFGSGVDRLGTVEWQERVEAHEVKVERAHIEQQWERTKQKLREDQEGLPPLPPEAPAQAENQHPDAGVGVGESLPSVDEVNAAPRPEAFRDQSAASAAQSVQNPSDTRPNDAAQTVSQTGFGQNLLSASTSKGLPLLFGGQALRSAGTQVDANLYYQMHGIHVLPHDTVADFKHKVVNACQKVAETLQQIGTVESAALAKQYRSVILTREHTVMLFDPKPEHNSSGSMLQTGSLVAMRKAMMHSHENPANWQELPATITFAQCASKFVAFSRAKSQGPTYSPPLLRIVDLTGNSYTACRNEVVSLRPSAPPSVPSTSVLLQDVNDEDQCFAYAQYRHREDDNSIEWRPCLIRPSVHPGKPNQTIYQVSWAATRSRVLVAQRADLTPDEESDSNAVLFAAHPVRVLERIFGAR